MGKTRDLKRYEMCRTIVANLYQKSQEKHPIEGVDYFIDKFVCKVIPNEPEYYSFFFCRGFLDIGEPIYAQLKKRHLREFKACEICGFDKTVDVHHINGRKDDKNLITLCPNHHFLIHRKKMTIEQLKKECMEVKP